MSADFHRHDAALKVTGQATYAAEAPVPGQLHAVLVGSAITSGTVLSVDGSQAAVMPGYADLVSYPQTATLTAASFTQLIRDPVIHFPGQPVALVVADTLLDAYAAAREVRVTYNTSPAVTTIGQGLEHAYEPAMAGRIAAASKRGDAATAIDNAKLVVRQRYETAVNNHHPMETHAVICSWEGNSPTIYTSTQGVFAIRPAIARAFSPPETNVRVVAPFIGGGFGSKGALMLPWMFLAMLASRRTQRPVRLELTRSELFSLVGRRSQTRQDLTVGFHADGRLAGIEHHVLAQTATHGEYADTTGEISRILYRCDNVTTSHRLVRTNAPLPIPMRAPGAAPGTFAFESALDEAATKLGIDPVELRVLNFADHDQDAGPATRSLTATASVPIASAGRSGPSPVPQPMAVGGSVGAWPPRSTRNAAKTAQYASHSPQTPDSSSSAAPPR